MNINCSSKATAMSGRGGSGSQGRPGKLETGNSRGGSGRQVHVYYERSTHYSEIMLSMKAARTTQR